MINEFKLDAERYRWLRSQFAQGEETYIGEGISSEEDLDKYIDGKMREMDMGRDWICKDCYDKQYSNCEIKTIPNIMDRPCILCGKRADYLIVINEKPTFLEDELKRNIETSTAIEGVKVKL